MTVSVSTNLRPDQLLKKQREEVKSKQILADGRKPKKFKAIRLLPEKTPKDRFFYCEKCLRKYRFKYDHDPTNCLKCGTGLMRAKSRTAMRRIVCTLKKGNRLLKSAKPKKVGYAVYLQSPLWKRIRKRILKRDEHLCRDCGREAKHVHHLSYAPLVMFGRDDSKLLSLCVSCHDARHPYKPSMAK